VDTQNNSLSIDISEEEEEGDLEVSNRKAETGHLLA
jgi:hypothetical protein